MSTTPNQLPTPTPDANIETQPFFDAAANDELRLPVCTSCGHIIWYPRSFCSVCSSPDVTWQTMTGDGTIYSYTVVEKGQGTWRHHSPYVLAYVELAEGPRMLTNIVDANAADIAVGSPVRVAFDHNEDGGTVVRFSLA